MSRHGHVLLSNFVSSSNMFFIRLFLANTWKKKKEKRKKNRGWQCLFPHKLWQKVDIVLRSRDLRGGDWDEIQNSSQLVPYVHPRSSLLSVVFMCLISPTQKFILGKSTTNAKEWGKSRFGEISELWIFVFGLFCSPGILFSSELGFDCFAFAQKCLT